MQRVLKRLGIFESDGRQHPLAVVLDRFLEVADQGDPVAERAEDVVLEAQRLAAVGTDQLLLEQVDHSGLELVDQVVERGIGIVQIEAEGLVGGHRGGDPRLGPQRDRRQRKDFEETGNGLGRVEKGLGQTIVVSRSQAERAADRFEAIDPSSVARTSVCWAWASPSWSWP